MVGQGKESEQPKPATAFEQHAQTIVGLVLVAVLLWVGSTVTNTQVKVAEVSPKLDSVAARLETLEQTLNEFRRDYVRRIDYDRDQDRIESRFDDVESATATISRSRPGEG